MADKLVSLDDLGEFKTKLDESYDIADLQTTVTLLKDMVYNRKVSFGLLTDTNALLKTSDGYALEAWSNIEIN